MMSRNQIVGMRKAGHFWRQFTAWFNVTHGVAIGLLKKRNHTSSMKVDRGQGRTRKATNIEDRHLVRMAWQNPFLPDRRGYIVKTVQQTANCWLNGYGVKTISSG